MRVKVGESDPHRLDLEVHPFGRARACLFIGQVRNDVERQQRGDALAIGWDFVHVVIFEAHRDRVDPVRLMGGKIRLGHRAAVLPGEGGNGPCDPAVIEGLAPGARDVLKGVGLVGEAPDFACLGCATLGHEGAESREVLELGDGIAPLAGNDGTYGEPLARMADRIDKKILKGQVAEFCGERDPLRHGTGHGHRIPAAVGHARQVAESLRRPGHRGTTAGVEPVQRLAIPDDRKTVSADAVHRGFDHRQRDRGSERCIDGVAATGDCCDACLRGQRLRARDDVAGQDRLTAGRKRKLRVDQVGAPGRVVFLHRR